jgi:serine/threonine protein kinase
VREYVEAVSIRDALHNNGHIAEFRLYDLLIQAAAGLSALHRNEFEHGNLHERNLLLGTDGMLKLTDAGFNLNAAAVQDSPFSDSGLLIDHSADLRSLGQIVFKAITDQEWTSPTPPDPLDLQQFGLHTGAALILSQLLFKDGKENFATAADLSVSVKAVATFADNHVEPVEIPKRDASPRQYLMMSFLVVLLTIFWYILASQH